MITKDIIKTIEESLSQNDIVLAKNQIANLAIALKSFSPSEKEQFISVIKTLQASHPELFDSYDSEPLISDTKSTYINDDFDDAVYSLGKNLCMERVNDVIKIGEKLFGKKVSAEPPKAVFTGNEPQHNSASGTDTDTDRKQKLSVSESDTDNSELIMKLVIGGIAAATVIYILKRIF